MPELPDVEGFRRYLARFATGRPIRGVEVADRELLRNASPRALGRALAGRRFTEPERRGKWLLARTDGPATVLMHFGMTGLLAWSGRGDGRVPHDRIVFRFPDGELRYRNMRRLGGVWLARGAGEEEVVTGRLGPDAMSLDRARLGELLGRRRGTVKAALMDQGLLAGLGNLLVDEILWRAGVHPRAAAGRLDRAALDAVHGAMGAVLRESVRHARVPGKEGWLTGVRDDRGAACPRCRAPIRRAQVAGRTTCWCPRCQPAGR